MPASEAVTRTLLYCGISRLKAITPAVVRQTPVSGDEAVDWSTGSLPIASGREAITFREPAQTTAAATKESRRLAPATARGADDRIVAEAGAWLDQCSTP